MIAELLPAGAGGAGGVVRPFRRSALSRATTLSAVYGAAAAWRRAWYDAPSGAASAASIGRSSASATSRVGGSGKTPLVEYSRACSSTRGERPAILSRGYGRRVARRRRDRRQRRHARARRRRRSRRRAADAGARRCPASSVARRRRPLSVAAALAERQLGATVHILDDGFQHFAAGARRRPARDRAKTTSATGRCRRDACASRWRLPPTRTPRSWTAGYAAGRRARRPRAGRAAACSASTRAARPAAHGAERRHGRRSASTRACSRSPAIARPERFFADLVVGRVAGGRHDARFAITTSSRGATSRRLPPPRKAPSAAIVLTTDKDAVRFAACDLGDLPIAVGPARPRRSSPSTIPALAARSCVAARDGLAVSHWLEYVAVRLLVGAGRA